MSVPCVGAALLSVLTALCLTLAPQRASAQVATAVTNALPRYYYCLLSVTELSKVDGVEQSFYVDTSFTCYYQEPGLTGVIPPGTIIPLPDTYKAQLQVNNSFFEPQFMNKRNLNFDLDRRFVFADVPLTMSSIALPNPTYPLATTPWIAVTQRFSGLFKAELALRDFPFDSQTLWVNVSSSTPDFMGKFAGPQWLPATTRVTTAVKEIIGWDIIGEQIFNGTTFAADYGVSLPDLGFAIRLKRQPQYYVNKIILGVVLITVMSQLTFLLSPRDSNRPVAAMTAFLGIVTYLFVISTDVPKVAYLTRMDRFVNLSFYFVFGDFFLHLIFYIIVRAADDAEMKAQRRRTLHGEGADAVVTDSDDDDDVAEDDIVPLREPFGAAAVEARGASKATLTSTNPIELQASASRAHAEDNVRGEAVAADANGDGTEPEGSTNTTRTVDPVMDDPAAFSSSRWRDQAGCHKSGRATSKPRRQGASREPAPSKGWWHALRYYLRALDFVLLGTLVVCYTLGSMTILTATAT